MNNENVRFKKKCRKEREANEQERESLYYPFQKSWQGRKEREREIWKVQIL
jgi:hypothetical protein